MLKTLYTTLLVPLVLLLVSSVQAQVLGIEVESTTYCEESCVFASAYGIPEGAVEFVWTITLVQTPGSGPVHTQTTEEPYFEWCDFFGGGIYILSLEVYDDAQELLGDVNYFHEITFIDPQVEIYASGSIINACEQDSFFINGNSPSLPCYDVCQGSSSTISIDELFAYGIDGSVQDISGQGQWNINGGEITPPEQEVFDGPTFYADEVYATPNATTCVPIRVHDFTNIQGFQFNINYDTNILSFVNATSFNTDLSPFFGPASVGYNYPQFVSWSSSSAEGVSLEDGAILLEFCFSLNQNQSSNIVLSNAEIGQELMGIIPNLSNGAILVNPPSEPITITWHEEGTGSATYSGWGVNAFGCEYYFEVPFCFNVAPPPAAEFSTQPVVSENGILEICEGQTVYFSNESENVESYTWDFGDGNGASSQNPNHTYTAAGTYEISLITDSGCECADTSSVTVIVQGNDAPFVDCVATICEGTAVTYTSNTGCSSYLWEISGNGTILDGGNTTDDFITIEWGAGPIGEITLATDGCPDLSDCTEAAYLQIPIVSANAPIEGPDRVCPGEQAVYTLPPFEGTEFTWNVSNFGTIIAGQGTPSVTIEWFDGPIPNNTQLLSVDYSNCYLECGGSASLDVVIRPEFYATGDIQVCENTTTDYSVVSMQTSLGFPANFDVQDDSGTSVWSNASPSATANITWDFGAGDYTIYITAQNANDFCGEDYRINVTVIAQPAAPTAILGQNEICVGINYTYEVDNPIDGERYRWTITNGTDISEREGTSISVAWGASAPYHLSLVRLSPPKFCASAPISMSMNTVGSFMLLGQDEVCLDQLASYTSDQTGDVYYNWSILPANAGTITGDPTAADIEVLWHFPGNAEVILEICGQQESMTVDVHAPPQPIVNHPANICANTTEMVSTAQVFSTYSWQDAEGNELSSSATPNLGGGYYRLVVTDDIGCEGSTNFHIYEFPASPISISTPDYNLFCGVPPMTTMYAVNAQDSYTYQWYQNGSALAGETSTQYTATSFGIYHVEIIDENGCSFASNVIDVREDCDDTRCTGAGAACINPDHDYDILENGSCDNRAYQAITGSLTPLNLSWDFDDPTSANNTATGTNVNHVYTKPGFYRVLLVGTYDDGAGGSSTCIMIKPDTVFAVADFDYDGVCPGAPVQFYDLSTFLDDFTDIASWDWDFGDPTSASNTATDKDPMHTFTGEGTYNVSLTVTTTTGCTASITKEVLIYPLPYTNFTDPTITCAATTLAFEADVASTVDVVQWTFGEASAALADTSTLFNTYHSYAGPGFYTVNLEATSVYGCSNTYSSTIEITPNNLAGQIDPTGLNTICEEDVLTLNAPTSIATEWNWSTGEQTQSIEVDAADSYSVTLTSDEGCTYTPDAVVVDVIPAPQSPIAAVSYNDFGQVDSYTYDTLFICQGEEVFLETEQQAGLSYSWSTGDTDVTAEFSENRGNLLAEGTHTIELTVTNTASNCSAVEVFVIVVHGTPDTPILDALGNTLCSGTSHTINITNVDASASYYWSNGDEATSITTDEAAVYYATAINEFGCISESESIEILEGPDISLVPNGCHTRCAPDTICMPQIPNVVSYQWYQDGMAIAAPAGTMTELIITEAGSYTLEMLDTDGCVQTSEPLNVDILPGFGTISGSVYFDTNDNQIIDAADDLAANISIEIANATSNPLNIITSNSLGNYGFIDMPEDDYTLRLDSLSIPEGWKAQIASIDTTFMGCDQEVNYDWLIVPDCIDSTFTASVCPGESFAFHGQDYAIGSSQTIAVSHAGPCDSMFTFSVAALHSSTEDLLAEVCPEERYTYNGQAYDAGTDLQFQYVNSVGCDSIVRLVVNASQAASIDFETEKTCANQQMGQLNITNASGALPLTYAIDDNNYQSISLFENLSAGHHDLNYQDANGCTYTEALDIEALPALVVAVEEQVEIPCAENEIELRPNVMSGDDGQLNFVWSDGVLTQDRPVSSLGLLGLSVSNACETQNFSINVSRENIGDESLVYVPNAFSPNGDGKNDVFIPLHQLDVEIEALDFQIYDRWGVMVFDAEHAQDAWTGIFNGEELPTAVYIWQMEATINLCGRVINYQKGGDVLLVR